MAVQAIDHHSFMLLPPLDMPLKLRMETGRFGAPRPKLLRNEPPCSQDFTHPREEDLLPPGVQQPPFRLGLHEAVDLDSEPGNCVYAAYNGRVIEVEILDGGSQGHVKIDHHPGGLGYVTNYIHIADIQVSTGDFVERGQPFASVGDVPDEPHLHFELHLVIDRSAFTEGGPNNVDMVPIDPTRWLYHWEQEFIAEARYSPDPQVPKTIAVIQGNHFPFFEAVFTAEIGVDLPQIDIDLPQLDPSLHPGLGGTPTKVEIPYYVPLYEPTTLDERVMVEMLREAFHNQREVIIRYRWSKFFDRRIITGVYL